MLICVTDRKLCREDFLARIEQIAKGKPYGIMLREKDLIVSEYESLAKNVKEVCDTHGVPLIINKYLETAAKLGIPNIHLSMPDLRTYKDRIHQFEHVGASVHSAAEAEEAQKLGASCLIAGHIFSTDCKKGVPPRGLSFLKDVCDSVNIPVFAIGGITKDKASAVTAAGAKGACIMSEAMTCESPAELLKNFCI